MKTIKRTLKLWTLALLALATFTGCRTTGNTERELATIQAVAAEASWLQCTLDLRDNPHRRPHYEVARSALSLLSRQDSITLGQLRSAIANLPELRGSTGAVVQSGLMLYVIGVGWLDIDTAPRVRAAVAGLVEGLDRALDGPAVAPERLPRQARVPERI